MRLPARLILAALAILMLVGSIVLAWILGGLGAAANTAQIVSLSQLVVLLVLWAVGSLPIKHKVRSSPNGSSAATESGAGSALENNPESDKTPAVPSMPSRILPGRRHLLGAAIIAASVALVATAIRVVIFGIFGGSGPGAPPNLSSCPLASPGDVVVVSSVRANSPQLDASTRLLNTLSFIAGYGGSSFGIVSVDGKPRVVSEGRFTPGSNNAQVVNDARDEYVKSLVRRVSETRAVAPEADVMGAVETAARYLRSRSERADSRGTIILIDSGLATAGTVDFTTSATIDTSPQEFTAYLRNNGALPDFSGINVLLVGVGNVAGQQQRLRAGQRERLVAFWSEILEAGHVSCVDVVEDASATEPPADVPPVKTVNVPALPAFKRPDPVQPPEELVLTNGPETGFQAEFEPDSTLLVNVETVRNILAPIVDWLAQNRARQVTVTGTTANVGSLEDQVSISTQRAKVIGDLLVQAGASPSQVAIAGVGSHFPQYREDRGPGGELIPAVAQANRTIRIVASE